MSENAYVMDQKYKDRLSKRFSAEQIAKLSELMLRSQALHARLAAIYEEAEELLEEHDIPFEENKVAFDAIFNDYVKVEGERWPELIA